MLCVSRKHKLELVRFKYILCSVFLKKGMVNNSHENTVINFDLLSYFRAYLISREQKKKLSLNTKCYIEQMTIRVEFIFRADY